MTKIIFTAKEFQDLKEKAEGEYQGVGKINCPFLKEGVNFNVKGWDHLRLKRWNHSRPRKDQFMRLKHISLAPEIIKLSKTVQGSLNTKNLERVKVNKRWDTILLPVYYREFIAVISDTRVRIVIKKVDKGEWFFWSLIPFWRQSSQGKRFHEGNPEED